MGDPGQLPPVNGQGAFTNRTPDVFLTEIWRQAADSPIIHLATLAREGKPIPVGDYGDGVRVEILNPDSQVAIYREETQAICGIHRVRWGYTQRIRRIRGFDDPLPQVGERLICRRNNKAHAIFNGGMGELIEPVSSTPDGFVNISVQMDHLKHESRKLWTNPYRFEEHFKGPAEKPPYLKGCNEFDWGNVLTCHSAQGSEYDDVTLIDDSGAFREDRHKWAYTGLTRASKRLVFLKRAA
jgi:exodeoxyribonuclease-5